MAGPLLRTLRTGVFDELVWPAFEEAMTALGGETKREILVEAQWPWLILGDGTKVWVLGPNGVETVHDVKWRDHEVPDVAGYVGGQLYLGWNVYRPSYGHVAYWSGAPTDTFDIDHCWGNGEMPWSDDQRLLLGTTVITVGDRVTLPRPPAQLHTRDRSWILVDEAWHLQDRATGAPGMADAPEFVAGADPNQVAFFPLPDPIVGTTPLPHLDGQYGARRVDGVFETLGGPRYPGTFFRDRTPVHPAMLVRWPHTEVWRAVHGEAGGWRLKHDWRFQVADPDHPVASLVRDDDERSGAAVLPPSRYWHYLVPRDPAGSAALRAATPEIAEALVAAGIAEHAGTVGATLDAVAAHLPGVTDPVLKRGLALIALQAGAVENRLRAVATARAGGDAPAAVSGGGLTESDVGEALCTFGYGGNGGADVVEGIVSLGSYLVRDGETGRHVKFTRVQQHEWVGRIRAIAVAGARVGLEPEQRALFAPLLSAWRDSGLTDAGWSFRRGKMTFDRLAPWVCTKLKDGHTVPFTAFRRSTDGEEHHLLAYGISEIPEGPWTTTYLESTRDGTFRDWESARILQVEDTAVDGDAAWIDAWLAAYAEGASNEDRMTPQAVEALAARTGHSFAEAAVLLALFPRHLDGVRGRLGLKSADVSTAIAQFSGIDHDQRLSLLADAAPADPRRLWSTDPEDPEGLVVRLGNAWVARFGRAVAVPADLLTAASKELGWSAPALVRQIAIGSWPELRSEAAEVVEPGGALAFRTGEVGLNGASLTTVARALAWLVGQVPVGDPVIAHVADIHRTLVARASNPDLWLSGGHAYGDLQAFADAIGGERTESDGVTQRRSGSLVVTVSNRYGTLVFRPSTLAPHERELVESFGGNARSAGPIRAWEVLRSDDLQALFRRTVETPLPPGTWEQDPTRSAPEVVAAAAAHLGLSERGAALYLQTATLLAPTKKAVCTWNGWTSKGFDAAVAEGVEKGLYIVGKRARSGREHYLPGPWVERSSGALPYEEWKLPLYTPAALDAMVPLAPFGTLFARAWERWTADPPKFEETPR